MTDDLLAQMTRALADEHDGATAVPEATRGRVIRTLSERRPRRSKWLLVGVPAFALLGGGTAFAAATGQLPRIVEKALAVFTGEAELEGDSTPPEERQLAEGSATRSSALRSERPDPEGVEEEPAEEQADESVVEAPTPRLADVSRTQSPTPKSKPPVVKPRATPDPTLLVYRAAHEAHFKQGDCEGAVRGYKAYLRDAPSGTFSLEAQYNLGVCLTRLGRTDEARVALTPFAEGKHGDYRKSQAQDLLDALGD